MSNRLNFSAASTEALFVIVSEIDAIKYAFRLTDKLLPQTINRLTQSVIVTSTGASNRIEGNRLSDEAVEGLYRNLRIRKFRTRDEQEVAGYLEVLELILGSYADMVITESLILQLHRDMLKFSDKDERQRGAYKFGPNRVEAKDQSGFEYYPRRSGRRSSIGKAARTLAMGPAEKRAYLWSQRRD